MNALVAEWIEKAESDYRAAEREMRVRKEPSYDVVCFHAQQCAEKYLKAITLQQNLPLRRIHDLEVLLDLVIPDSPSWADYRDPILLLNDYSVDIRYPGEMASKEEARAAVGAMRKVRVKAREELGL